MKKFFFLTGVALCALTLATSCVKDIESASVTSLRNAKTEQILASAELSRAQAAAATLTAQADANLKSAQAEYQKAQAAYYAAQAERQQLENAFREAEMDAEKAEIAERIARAEANEAAAQQQLQNTLNQIERNRLQFEYDMAQLVASLEKQKANAAINELNTAATNYKTAVKNLLDAQTALNNEKVELAKLEIGQADWENTKAKDIAEYKHLIAQNQAEIEMYKQYANYTEDVQALEDKYNALYNKYSELSDNYEAAFNGYYTPVEHTAEKAAEKKLEENPFWKMFYTSDHSITLSDGETKILFTDTRATSWIVFNYATEPMEKVIATYTDKAGIETPYSVSINKVINKAKVNIDGKVSGEIEKVGADVINMKIKEDKANYAKDKKDLETILKALNDELTLLKEDMAAKLTELNAIEVNADGYNTAKTAYEDAVKAVNDKQGEIDTQNENIKSAAQVSEAYDIIADFVVKYADNCKAVDALYDEVLEGAASDYAENAKYWLEKNKLFDEKSEVDNEKNAIYVVLNNYGDPKGASVLAGWIEGCENAIKEYQRYIDNYELDLDPFNPHGYSKEQTIEAKKKTIASQEEYIKSLEVIANQRKAEYEAVLAKYQNAE